MYLLRHQHDLNYGASLLRLLSLTAVPKVSLLCQAASLMVAVKTEQFKREIAARKKASAGGGTEKAKRAVKEKDAPKQE